jgi:hypothetical protein
MARDPSAARSSPSLACGLQDCGRKHLGAARLLGRDLDIESLNAPVDTRRAEPTQQTLCGLARKPLCPRSIDANRAQPQELDASFSLWHVS